MAHTRFTPGTTVRIRDQRWVVIHHAPGASASILDVRGRDRTNLDARASFLLPFEAVETLASDRSPRLVSRGRWRHRVRALLADVTPSWTSLRTPRRARISLLPFQLEPALAVTHGIASRILIADEVGLGKTIQAALIVSELLDRTPYARVLIVAPASLKDQWQAELHERFAIEAWQADSVSLARLGASWGTTNPWVGRPVTITSIDFVKRPEVMRSLEGLIWDAVIFDEAHGLAGHSDRAAASALLARRARTVVLLTATPHSGDERAFEALRAIGDLDAGFPLLTFRRTRRDAGLAVSRRTTALHIQPTLAEREMHRALGAYARKVRGARQSGSDPAHLAMIVLTKRACSSPSSLARSVERRLQLLPPDGSFATPQLALPLFDLPADEEPGVELSAPGLDDRSEERKWLERILLLARRAQSSPSKLRAITRLLRRAGEPAIVFTEYRDTLATMAEVLGGLMPVTLHGGLGPEERRASLRSFTSGSARLLLATDAASEGLNLQQRCRLVINLEIPWTPLRIEQRVGRVERIGQTHRVHALHLVSAGTAEESHLASLTTRSERVAGALGHLSDRSPALLLLQARAQAEAARIEGLRAITGSKDYEAPDARPHFAFARSGVGRRGDLWAFHVEVSDAGRRLAWRALLGAVSPSPPRSETTARFIDAAAQPILTGLESDVVKLFESFDVSRREHAGLASLREQAIARALSRERARLSVTLLQPGLFDRRAERAFAAQDAVLEEALGRCRARLDDIAAATQLAVEPTRLAFALIRR